MWLGTRNMPVTSEVAFEQSVLATAMATGALSVEGTFQNSRETTSRAAVQGETLKDRRHHSRGSTIS